MAKDRAAPFSKKHRKYWIPVTGGMLLIGGINVAIGVLTYDEPPPPERIEVKIPGGEAVPGTLRASDLPAPVMKAFAVKYPQTIPAGASFENGQYIVFFPPGKPHAHAVFTPDGGFVSEQ